MLTQTPGNRHNDRVEGPEGQAHKQRPEHDATDVHEADLRASGFIAQFIFLLFVRKNNHA